MSWGISIGRVMDKFDERLERAKKYCRSAYKQWLKAGKPKFNPPTVIIDAEPPENAEDRTSIVVPGLRAKLLTSGHRRPRCFAELNCLDLAEYLKKAEKHSKKDKK